MNTFNYARDILIKQSNGYILVESVHKKGSAFTIYLPRTLETVNEEESPAPSKEIGEYVENTAILLVEDEESMRLALVEYLSKNGFRVVSAPNAEEALRLCERLSASAFHVLLTDVVMPGLGGADLAARFRTLNPDAKVVFMSGYTDDVLNRSGINPSQIAILNKPFELETLAKELRS